MGFALNLAQDQRGSLRAVAKRLGLVDLEALAPYVDTLSGGAVDAARAELIDRLRAALGPERKRDVGWFINVEGAPDDEPDDALPHGWPDSLLDLWSEIENSRLQGAARGKELERFMHTFFDAYFDVIDRNLYTATGEIDLAMLNPQAAWWSRELGTLAFVECKNRREKSRLGDIDQFAGAMRRRWPNLGFFVARAGFTQGAQEVRRIHDASGDLLIVGISGADIRKALTEKQEPADFFQSAILRAMANG